MKIKKNYIIGVVMVALLVCTYFFTWGEGILLVFVFLLCVAALGQSFMEECARIDKEALKTEGCLSGRACSSKTNLSNIPKDSIPVEVRVVEYFRYTIYVRSVEDAYDTAQSMFVENEFQDKDKYMNGVMIEVLL